MISIVVHGVLGTAYRQDIVVDGGAQGNGDVKVLCDLRQHLSTQYGDGTPNTGWAISPTPSGMWINRVERAFDANYAPAYLMVSVLIPRGQRLKDDSVLNKISRAMILNHSKYISQNVIQDRCDWSFLDPLSQDLEGCLEPFDCAISNYTDSTDGEIAYYDGDLSGMIREMWSDKFVGYGMVFCGRGVLTLDKDFPSVEVIEKKTSETEGKPSEGLKFEKQENKAQIFHVDTIKDEKTHLKPPQFRKLYIVIPIAVISVVLCCLCLHLFFNGRKVSQLAFFRLQIAELYPMLNANLPHYCGDSLYYLAESICNDYKQEVLAEKEFEALSDTLFTSFLVAYELQKKAKEQDGLIYDSLMFFFASVDNQSSMMDLQIWTDFKNSFPDGKYENSYLTKVHLDMINVKYNELLSREKHEIDVLSTQKGWKKKEDSPRISEKEKPSRAVPKNEEPMGKVRITNADELFRELCWDNVKDGEEMFWQNHELIGAIMENKLKRSNNIIRIALKYGEHRYKKAYEIAKNKEPSQDENSIYLLEKALY